MAFTLLPPILIVAGLVATLVVLIRRVPQTASLKGQELVKAQKALEDLEANPTRLRRVLRSVGRLAKLAGTGLKNVGSFLGEKVFKKLASSQAVTGFFTRLFARLHRTRTQQGAPTVVASQEASEQVVSQPQTKAVEETKKEHEQAMEVARLEKEARHELLMNNLSAAEKLYIEMIARDPKAIGAYRGLAEIYEKQGNHRDMKASLEQILVLDKHNLEAKKQLEKLAQAEAVA